MLNDSPVSVMVCCTTYEPALTECVDAGANDESVEYSRSEFAGSFVSHVTSAVEPSIAVDRMFEMTGPLESVAASANITSTQ